MRFIGKTVRGAILHKESVQHFERTAQKSDDSVLNSRGLLLYCALHSYTAF